MIYQAQLSRAWLRIKNRERPKLSILILYKKQKIIRRYIMKRNLALRNSRKRNNWAVQAKK
ncbi:hypothetical protein EN12_21590 [Vibrio cholerae]|nr:hypothetical protein EN12_21590 [Vibrio cholerae]